jgi:hypothetical protein
MLGLAYPRAIVAERDDVVVRMEIFARPDEIADRNGWDVLIEGISARPPREDAHNATSPACAGDA